MARASDQEELVHVVDITTVKETDFARRCVGCLILSRDNRILLQLRDEDCFTYPGCLGTFGGGIETGETPLITLVRELKEELGADVKPNEAISLGAITEATSNHTELVYVYFWHDQEGTITGCYEGQAKYYQNTSSALAHPKVMSDVVWLLHECTKRKLI